MASIAQQVSERYRDYPEHNRGENHHHYGEPNRPETRHKISLANRGRGPYPGQSEWTKEYYAKNPDKHPNRILAQRGHETGIERTMRLALEAKGISFEKQYPLGGCFIDFAVIDSRLAIEVDGAYWHDAARDARRDARLIALGWRVLHFSDQQVNQHLDDCTRKIEMSL